MSYVTLRHPVFTITLQHNDLYTALLPFMPNIWKQVLGWIRERQFVHVSLATTMHRLKTSETDMRGPFLPWCSAVCSRDSLSSPGRGFGGRGGTPASAARKGNIQEYKGTKISFGDD